MSKLCIKCNATLDDNAQFCNKCGSHQGKNEKSDNKSKGKLIIIPIVLVVIIIGIVVGWYVIHKDDDEFRKQVTNVEETYTALQRAVNSLDNANDSNWEVSGKTFREHLYIADTNLDGENNAINKLDPSYELSNDKTLILNINQKAKEIIQLSYDTIKNASEPNIKDNLTNIREKVDELNTLSASVNTNADKIKQVTDFSKLDSTLDKYVDFAQAAEKKAKEEEAFAKMVSEAGEFIFSNDMGDYYLDTSTVSTSDQKYSGTVNCIDNRTRTLISYRYKIRLTVTKGRQYYLAEIDWIRNGEARLERREVIPGTVDAAVLRALQSIGNARGTSP